MAREQSPASPLISPPRPTAPYPLPPHSPSHSPPGVAAIPAIPVIPPAPPPAPSDAPPAPDAPPALSHAPDAPAAPAARYDSDDDEDSDVDDRHPLLDEHSVPRRPQAASPGPSGSGRSYPPLRCPTRRYYPSYPVAPPVPAQCRGRPHGFRIPDSLKPWLGIGSWAVTSIGFLLAIAFWKKEVFTGTYYSLYPCHIVCFFFFSCQPRSRPTVTSPSITRIPRIRHLVLFNFYNHYS